MKRPTAEVEATTALRVLVRFGCLFEKQPDDSFQFNAN